MQDFQSKPGKSARIKWLRVNPRFSERIKQKAEEDGITISQAIERYATVGLGKAAPRGASGK